MRTVTGLFLIALGAILAFAVQGHPSWLNIQVAGWVLMLTGIAGMVIPRRGYGWLRRRIVLRRGPGGRPAVDRVEEKHYPPYVMLNPGSNALMSDAAEGGAAPGGATPAGAAPAGAAPAGAVATEEVPTVVGPFEDPDPAGLADDPGPDQERLAAEREAAVARARAEWEAAEDAAPPGGPVPAEEIVEQYVEE